MKNGKLLLLLFFTQMAVGKTLTVGVALRLNDAYNNSVNSIKRGIETAKTLYEKEHPGVRVNLQVFPHSKDLASVNAAADKIIAAKLPAVVGGEMSEESIVLGDRLDAAKTVFITPTSSNPSVTENKPFVFRACFSDKQVADEMAKYVSENLKPTKMGVIHNISSPYTDYLSSRFVETFSQLAEQKGNASNKSINVEKVKRGTLDFSKQIDRFKAENVTHVVMFTHDNDLIRFNLQAEEREFFPVYIGSDGWGTNQFVYDKFVKESSKGERFIGIRNSYWKETNTRKITRDFKKTFESQFHEAPGAWNAIGFDATWVLLKAMDKAENPASAEEIRKEMKKTRKISLVTSERFSFNKENSPQKDLYLFRVSKQGIQYEATLK